jgi:Short C-terminal domain
MGLIGGIARTAVVAGTWTAVSNEVTRRQAGRWAAQDQSAPTWTYKPPMRARYQRPMFQEPAQRRARHGPPPPPPAPPPAAAWAAPQPVSAPPDAMTTRLAQLQQLADLKDRGVLTEAEFEAQKARILS